MLQNLNGEIMHFTINKKTKIIFRLVLAAVLLLSLPFLFKGFGILILFAFVPILMLQNYIETNGVKYGWSIIFSTFLLWTIATTYWIGYANFKGAVASMVLYSLSLTVLILLYGSIPVQ